MIRAGQKSVKLKTGQLMPIVGLGTWQLAGEKCVQVVKKAIGLGYRHIDTAELYANETDIGKAIKGFDREKLFITSKVKGSNLRTADLIRSAQASLKRLNTDYLDLYLIHWPNDNVSIEETMFAMNKLVEQKKVLAIGVSNFSPAKTAQAMRLSGQPIVNNQTEFHPYVNCEPLIRFCRKNSIVITAYSPLAYGRAAFDQLLISIGADYGKSAAQVAIRWLIQKGCVVIPKAAATEHLRQNIQVFDWQLSESDMERIDLILARQKLVAAVT